jgi:hypothetical protein
MHVTHSGKYTSVRFAIHPRDDSRENHEKALNQTEPELKARDYLSDCEMKFQKFVFDL